MIKTLRYISFIISLLVLAGCSDDDWLFGNSDNDNGELPVEFTFEWPGITGTRGFDDANVKTKFEDEDVIHIVGTFKTKALQEDGTYKEGITARYGALKYNQKTRQWEAVAGNKLTWPSISTEGNFYAYYISKANGLITSYSDPVTVSLSDVTPQTDPLMAPETGWMVYGHAVNLQFQHLCSYLTLIDLEPMVASRYFFTTNEVGVLPPGQEGETGGDTGGTAATEKMPFHNAFRLVLEKNDGSEDAGLKDTPQLKFEFFSQGDPDFNDMVYISGNAATMAETDPEGDTKNVTKVGYFLEPGTYNTFELKYPSIAPDTYLYLSYNYADIPPSVGGIEYTNIPPDLKAGTTYTLTVTKSPGVKIVSPPPGEGWDEKDEYDDVEVDKFLRAVREGTDYFNTEGTQILEAVPGGTKLLKNVDFKGENYEDFEKVLGFLPDVLEGKTFDGNLHYIKNLGCPLFRYNYGTITNLGIKGATINAESIEYSYDNGENTQDRSRHGALCMWNRSDSRISNVRVSDVTMKIEVQYNNNENDGNEVHNIGAVVGSNTGHLDELYLGGKFTVNVGGNNLDNAEVLIGGVSGQNAGSASINDVSMLNDDFSIIITNSCVGAKAMYSVGGIVGASSGFISGVILSDVVIDCRDSSGLVSYLGGMAGQLAVSNNSNGSMTSCIVSGSVTAGITKGDEFMAGQAYTGGMAGYDDKVSVTGCRASVSVTGASSVYDKVTYGTGGAFGRIYNPSTFENLIAYGAKLVAPAGNSNVGSSYIGNFAGIVPQNETWEGNYAGNNIIFHTFEGLPPVGTSM